MTPGSTAGVSIEEFISTFVTYKYIRLRHPQWLGLTHFVLRLLLIVGYSECPPAHTYNKSAFASVKTLRAKKNTPITAAHTPSPPLSGCESHTDASFVTVACFVKETHTHMLDVSTLRVRSPPPPDSRSGRTLSTQQRTFFFLNFFIHNFYAPSPAPTPHKKTNSWTVRDFISQLALAVRDAAASAHPAVGGEDGGDRRVAAGVLLRRGTAVSRVEPL